MKEWPFQQRGQLPIASNVPILKLGNLIVCSVHSALHPITTQSLDGGGLACLPVGRGGGHVTYSMRLY